MIFQQFNLVKRLSVIKNVLVGSLGYKSLLPSLCHIYSKDEKLRALACLDQVDIVHKAYQRADTLSGGEQQRVALARAIIMEPKVVLADEPTGNLDSKTSSAVHDLFFDLNKRRGTTFLVVTHSADLAAKMPRVVQMRDGRIEQDRRNGK